MKHLEMTTWQEITRNTVHEPPYHPYYSGKNDNEASSRVWHNPWQDKNRQNTYLLLSYLTLIPIQLPSSTARLNKLKLSSPIPRNT